MENNIIPIDKEDIDLLDNYYSVHSKEDKLQCIDLFCKGSSLAEISSITKVPKTTLQNWKDRSPWWEEIVSKYRKDKQIELDNKLTQSIHTTLDLIADRLSNGDMKPDRNGVLQYIPVNARDLSVVLNTLYEKRALIRGEATSIKTESQTTLKSLEDKFKSFALQLKEKNVVSEQQPALDQGS